MLGLEAFHDGQQPLTSEHLERLQEILKSIPRPPVNRTTTPRSGSNRNDRRRPRAAFRSRRWPRNSWNALARASGRRSPSTCLGIPTWPRRFAIFSRCRPLVEDLKPGSGDVTGSFAGAEIPGLEQPLEHLGDYRVLRVVGRGGMGVVYEAEQESLGRRVALKVLSASGAADAKQVRRFEREAWLPRRLHHTNIVPVFGVGEQDGHHFFVMQFIAGSGPRRGAGGPAAATVGQGGGRPGPARAAASRIAGPMAAEVARSLMSGRFAGDGPIPLGRHVTDSGGEEVRAAPPSIAPAADPLPRSPCPAPPSCPPRPTLTASSTARWPGSASRWPRLWSTPTARASCIAMSSRPTSCWTAGATSGWPTSDWPRRATRTT